MPRWHEEYFELQANENQQVQKEAFPELPLSDERKTLMRNEKCSVLINQAMQRDGRGPVSDAGH